MDIQDKKVVCLMPVKNEASILPVTLNIISQYCDLIIIADQMSTDGSREIYRDFSKVVVIDNNREGHSNEVRWDLLKKAREYGDNNIILCLDADEYIPVGIFKKFIEANEFKIGESFRFPWIQLWKSINYYNNTGVWFRNYQRAMWVDDGKTEYDKVIVINDHTSRVPQKFLENCQRVDIVPIIHLQWVFWDRTQLKQAWYRCMELIKEKRKVISINSAYALSLDKKNVKLRKVQEIWIKDLKKSSLKLVESNGEGYLKEIFKLFDKMGILYFEPLQIWHIEELKSEFIKRTEKDPTSVQENKLVTVLRNLKLKIVKLMHY